MMEWKIDKSYPICSQIQELVCLAISKGEYKKDNKIYSVRELAIILGVNPNTIQKAYEELELNKIIYSIRGSGWYINDNIKEAKKIVEQIREKKTKEYLKDMNHLGVSKEDVIKYLMRAGEDK